MTNTTLSYSVSANTARRHVEDLATLYIGTTKTLEDFLSRLEDETHLLRTLLVDWKHHDREIEELDRQAKLEETRQKAAAAARETETASIF
jgi:hypothetical protein